MDQQYNRRLEDIKPCDNLVICPTSTREMDELKHSVEQAKSDYGKLTNEIKTNRKFDIAILVIGVVSLVLNIIMRSV